MVTTLTIALCLCFSFGCSSSSTSTNSGGGSNSGNFTNANLKGSYVYDLGGSFLGLSGGGNGFYQRAGTFVADGNGNITGGSDDLVQGTTVVTSQVKGTYAVAGDGTGLMLVTIGGTQYQFAFTLSSTSQLTLIEFDATASGAGGARLQTASAINAAPSGTFVFHLHSYQSGSASRNAVAAVGSFLLDGTTASGNEDIMRAGVFSSLTITGTETVPDKTGKGTLSLTDSSGIPSTFFYYVIDSSTVDLLETDSDANGPHLGTGRAELQAAGPFSVSSLKNTFVFSSSGDTESTLFGVVTIGAFASDGNGNIVSGSYDSVPDGVPIVNTPITGTYTVDPSGRMQITLNTQLSSPSTIPEVAWLVNSTRAFLLVNIPGRTEEGNLNQQSGSSFANASLKGTFAFNMFGHDPLSPPQIERVGVAQFDGSSSLSLTDYFINRSGSKNQTSSQSVTYAVNSNGRVTAAIPGISNNVVMYLISNNAGYLILEDTNTEVSGGILQQPSQ